MESLHLLYRALLLLLFQTSASSHSWLILSVCPSSWRVKLSTVIWEKRLVETYFVIKHLHKSNIQFL